MIKHTAISVIKILLLPLILIQFALAYGVWVFSPNSNRFKIDLL